MGGKVHKVGNCLARLRDGQRVAGACHVKSSVSKGKLEGRQEPRPCGNQTVCGPLSWSPVLSPEAWLALFSSPRVTSPWILLHRTPVPRASHSTWSLRWVICLLSCVVYCENIITYPVIVHYTKCLLARSVVN